MRRVIHVICVCVLCLAFGPAAQADTLAAKRYIIDNYVSPLPDSIVSLPWNEFEKYLDPYTKLLSPATLQYWQNRFASIAEGDLGIEHEWLRRGWVITDIAPYSPAFNMGLLPGDVITSLDGKPTGWPDANGDYVSWTGPIGRWVTLEVQRRDSCFLKPLPYGEYHTESVYLTVIDRTMCVVVLSFAHGTYDRLVKLTQNIRDEDIDTIILDLRNNSGGSVAEATDLLSEFIPYGDTVLAEQHRKRTVYITSNESGRWRRMRPTYVLLTSETASAGEIFVGGMSARTNALLIGSTSYGKGRIQRLIKNGFASSFADDSIAGMMITMARYLAGGTIKVDSIGVLPDLWAPLPLPASGTIPKTLDVTALRIKVSNPTRKTVDSVNGIAGCDVAHIIWCQRALPFEAYRAIDTMRDRLYSKPFVASTNYVMNDGYKAYDTPEILRALNTRYEMVRGSTTSIERSVEWLVKKLQETTTPSRLAADIIEEDGRGPVSYDLGLVLSKSGDMIQVARVLPYSSAYYAGVCPGDRILLMNGKPLTEDLLEVQAKIIQLAKREEPLVLRIRRGVRDVTIACEGKLRITTYPLSYVTGDVGYIAVDRFCNTHNAQYQIWRTMNTFVERGIRSVVFDLRGSQIGSYEHMMELLAYFFRRGDTMIVATLNSGMREPMLVERDGSYRHMYVTVVVNEDTKGPAEVFAAAIKRRGNSMIIGSRTFGEMADRKSVMLSSTVSVDYVWRIFGSERSEAVVPDVSLHLPIGATPGTLMLDLSLSSLQKIRSGVDCSTEECYERALSTLPGNLSNEPREIAASVILADGARLFSLSRSIAHVLGAGVTAGPR